MLKPILVGGHKKTQKNPNKTKQLIRGSFRMTSWQWIGFVRNTFPREMAEAQLFATLKTWLDDAHSKDSIILQCPMVDGREAMSEHVPSPAAYHSVYALQLKCCCLTRPFALLRPWWEPRCQTSLTLLLLLRARAFHATELNLATNLGQKLRSHHRSMSNRK